MRPLRGFVAAALLFASLASGGAPPAAAHSPSCSWPMYGRTPARSFAQDDPNCSAITAGNVATLRPKWIVPVADSVTASPAVKDGIVYVGSWDGTFYALDADDGSILWTFAIDDEHEVAFGRIVSSAAIDTIDVPGHGPVEAVIFGGGATLYALRHGSTGPQLLAKIDVDPRTPALRAAQAADPPEVEIESSPVVGHFPDGDRIYVGMDVHNRAGVGRTGLLSFGLRKNEGGDQPLRFELLYKFDPETGTVRHSLTDGSGEGLGCGGVWSSPMLARGGGSGVIVFGTSNCEHPNASADAEEIGAETVFGIEAKTGEELWRMRPRDPNRVDDDFGATPNLLPATSAHPAGMAGAAGKDGVYYAHDLLTGDLVYRTQAGQPGHLVNDFAIGGMIGSSATANVQMTWIPEEQAHLVFATTAFPTPVGDPLDSGGNPIDESLAGEPARLFSLHAIDAATGRIVWRSPLSGPSYGAPSFARNMVFVPVTFNSRLAVFDAATGLPLASLPTFGAPSSTPVVVGDSIFFGTGTRETDAEFKAFGNEAQEFFGQTIGAHPLSPLSSISAYTVAI